MGRMEYGKMIAGCAAALTTQTGKIGYLGPLINDETRRLAASAYLGAQVLLDELPGQGSGRPEVQGHLDRLLVQHPRRHLDPTQVADDFFNGGYDVVISGIDTTEAMVEAGKLAEEGKQVWAIPYDFMGACDEAPDGLPGCAVLQLGSGVSRADHSRYRTATSTRSFQWNGPDWADINNPDTQRVGFVKGDGPEPPMPPPSWTSSSPIWPAVSTCGPARSTCRTAPPTWPTAKWRPISRSGTCRSCSKAWKARASPSSAR